MKKFTKLTSMLLAGAMVLGCAAGCGSSGSSSGNDSTDSSAAGGSTELLIGGIGPVTGDYAVYGTAVQNGAQIAVDEINAAGGVNGFTFKLDFQDSQGSPDNATAAYGKLMDSEMALSLGGTLSGETAAVVAAAKEDGILVLTPSGSSKAAIAGSDTAFRVCFNDPAQGKASADYIAQYSLATKVAVFYASDNDYSVGLYQTFKDECDVKGIEIVDTQTFTDSTKTDFSTQIASIKNSGAELVFLPIYSAEASIFLTQAYGVIPDGTIYFGADGMDGILTDIDDPAKAENVFLLTPFSVDDASENVQSFVKTYTEKCGIAPNQFAADAYDAVYTFKAALEQAGITAESYASMSTEDFNAAMVGAMTQITVDGLTGNMTWTADGETVKDAKAMVIHDGKASLYEG